MIIYRLAIERLIKYLHLDELFKENEYRLMLLRKQKKEVYKTKLIMDQTMNLCVSILLSIISILVCLSIPYGILEEPCEKLQEYAVMYKVAKWMYNYTTVLDWIIIILCVLLVFVSVKTILDAIKATNIQISPWLERGKYVLPEKKKKVMSRTMR